MCGRVAAARAQEHRNTSTKHTAIVGEDDVKLSRQPYRPESAAVVDPSVGRQHPQHPRHKHNREKDNPTIPCIHIIFAQTKTPTWPRASAASMGGVPQARATARKAVYMAPMWAAPEAKK